METGSASHHLPRGWRATAKCKQGYSSSASPCPPAETQQLLQHPKGHWNAPAFSRTGHACCRLMCSTKSLSRCVLESIQGTYAGDQIFSPVSCVLPGAQVMQYKHIGTKESHQTHTRGIESLLARGKDSPGLLWDALMAQCARAWGSLLTLLTCSHTKLKWLSWIQHLLIISEHKCGTEWRHSILLQCWQDSSLLQPLCSAWQHISRPRWEEKQHEAQRSNANRSRGIWQRRAESQRAKSREKEGKIRLMSIWMKTLWGGKRQCISVLALFPLHRQKQEAEMMVFVLFMMKFRKCKLKIE